MSDVLASEYPQGLDLVFESVGGEMFETLVTHIATRGRIVVIGMISQYQDQKQKTPKESTTMSQSAVNSQLLIKSASVRGFFLSHFHAEFKSHMEKLVMAMMTGELAIKMDPTTFHGLESIADAVDFMYDRKNIGKLVVTLTKQEQ